LAAKVFWLRPKEGCRWHSPADVVVKLGEVFEAVTIDRDEAIRIGRQFVDTYALLLKSGRGCTSSPPLEVVERQWRDAVVLRVSDGGDAGAPFEVVVCTEDKLRLGFASKTPVQKKRRSAEKAAAALEYDIEYFDPDE
jgi:hypothetical protein